MTPEKKIRAILKENNLQFGYRIVFPRYRILPDEVQLALKVLIRHGMKIQFFLQKNKEVLAPAQKPSK